MTTASTLVPAVGEPWILVSLADHWTCALVCAELREHACIACCVPSIAAALLLTNDPIEVVLADRENLNARNVAVLRWSRIVSDKPAVALLAAADDVVEEGTCDRVLHRPVTIGRVVAAVEPLAMRRATQPLQPPPGAIELRLGPPWPAIRCTVCGHTRHCQTSQHPEDWQLARKALLQFAIEHCVHLGNGYG